jgi:hypothetical protein
MTMDMDMKKKDLPEGGPHDKDEAGEKEKESLKDEMRNVIEEARMVIPGIQALFGFQTMGVFNNRFEDIADSSKLIYLVALGLLVVSMGLLMTPAAYHRLERIRPDLACRCRPDCPQALRCAASKYPGTTRRRPCRARLRLCRRKPVCRRKAMLCETPAYPLFREQSASASPKPVRANTL